MKKFLSFTLVLISALILATNVYSAKADSIDIRDTLKVGLFYASTGKNQVTLESDEGLLIGYEQNYEFIEEYDSEKTEMTFTINDMGEILELDGETVFDSTKKLTIHPKDDIIKVNGTPYRGAIQLINGGGSITVINLVDTDDYVKGVIAREMPSGWAIEALKAQAVCARNYAVTSLNKHSSYGFDLCDNTNCQVYGGVNAETPSTIKAADETKDMYLMYDGELAETLFFSCDGGYTNESKYVWGSNIPYLTAKEDIYENEKECSRYNWTLTYTPKQIKDKLEGTGVKIGDITNIEITDVTASGQVYGLKITGTDGEKKYVNDKTRGALGSDGLLSQRYTVKKGYSDKFSAITSSKKNQACDMDYALDKDNKSTKIEGTPYVLSASSKTKLVSSPDTYIFEGHGWGHGLGMSQYGAKGMADKGFTYEEILEFYFTGAYLEGDSTIENQ